MLLANLVWPALYIAERYYSWWAIGAGLVLETIVLAKLTRRSAGCSLLMAAVANAASAIVGILAYRWLGFAWEFVLSFTIYQILPLGTFNPFGWLASVLLAALLSSVIECAVLRLGFRIPITRRFFLPFLLANIATAAVALVTVWTHPPEV